ncbi:SDR family oxidoreductase [Reichenbachiella sp.]|uniref:SDR family oxidoreductase n=1 Tax=Reichenbachiella sp. TaxID=2184521 RepID=UPI003B5B4B73
MSQYTILVTGGAGFIGSNLVGELLKLGHSVRVLDNLMTGSKDNLKESFKESKLHFIEGDIRDFDTCLSACNGVDYVFHQAALGSVPRSIKDPLTSNEVNVAGTLNVFYASVQAKVKSVIYAASSSTYGDSQSLPKVEQVIGNPLSPYAITKYVNELYADVFSKIYDIKFVGLRYFNVFGPKQNAAGAYAAVIPNFIQAILKEEAPVINGDGSISRDFTYIDNVVQANLKAMESGNEIKNEVFNIALGSSTTLSELYELLKKISGSDLLAQYGSERMGDVQHSLADISKAKKLLGYQPSVSVEEGLTKTFNWFKQEI